MRSQNVKSREERFLGRPYFADICISLLNLSAFKIILNNAFKKHL